MDTSKPKSDLVQLALRADMPHVVYADDLVHHFRLDVARARDAIRLGLFGPWFLVGGEPAVLRETLREHLRLRTAQRRLGDKEILADGRDGVER
jgi:hypothetical protein